MEPQTPSRDDLIALSERASLTKPTIKLILNQGASHRGVVQVRDYVHKRRLPSLINTGVNC